MLGKSRDEGPRVVGFDFDALATAEPPRPVAPPPDVPLVDVRPYVPAPPAQGIPRAGKVLIGFIVLAAVAGGLLRVVLRAPHQIDGPAAAPVKPVHVLEPLDLVAPPSIGGAPRYTGVLAKRSEHILYALAGGPKAGDIEIAYYGRDHLEYGMVAGAKLGAKISYAKWSANLRTNGTTVSAPRAFPGGYQCGTVTAPEFRGALCTWAGKLSAGAVMAFRDHDVAAVAATTAKARKVLETRH